MWNYKKISEGLNKNGYFEIKNYLTSKDLITIKENLVDSLNYIKPSKEKNLQKKYYEIKRFNKKLKGNWYDISKYNVDMLKMLHKKEMIEFVKKYFNSKVVYSGRPAIHVHDKTNDRNLLPHQETNQFAAYTLGLWIPIFDTNKKTGGLTVFEKSHLNGFFKHSLTPPSSFKTKKLWTKKFTNIDEKVYKKFKKRNLSIKKGNAVIFISSLIHSSFKNTDTKSVRIVITERFNPLKKLPYLQNVKAPIKIPYFGVDLNKIRD